MRIEEGESAVGLPIRTASYRLPIQRDQRYGQEMKMIHPSWNPFVLTIRRGLTTRKRSASDILPAKKNQTDGTQTPSVVPLRYLVGFITVVTITTRKFFREAGLAGQDLQGLKDAWAKAVQLHVTLWSRPYAKDGLW
jgi:hypothetical protein